MDYFGIRNNLQTPGKDLLQFIFKEDNFGREIFYYEIEMISLERKAGKQINQEKK